MKWTRSSTRLRRAARALKNNCVIVLLFCCYSAVVLLLFCYYSAAILLLFCCYSAVILLPFCCYSAAILLLFCCYAAAILLLFCGLSARRIIKNNKKIEAQCSAQTSLWQLLVLRLTFSWGKFGQPAQRYVAALPCLPILNTGAEALWDGLFNHPAMSEVQSFYKFLMRTAGFPLHIHVSDDTSSNDRLFHHYMDAHPDILTYRMLCRNHQTNLVMTAVYTCSGPQLLSDLYCATKFLRVGPYYFRCMVCLSTFVKRFFKVTRGTPSRLDRAFTDQLRDYFKSTHPLEALAHTERKGKRSVKSKQHFDTSIDAFFDFFNGGFPLVGDGGEELQPSRAQLCHICPGEHCCRSSAISAVRARKRLCVLLRCKPSSPELGKWTKVGPCFDFWLMGLPSFAFYNLLRLATGNAPFFRQNKPADRECKDMAAVDAGTDKADFHQAAGENYKRATSLLQCPSQCCKLVVLAIVLEPLRLLHSYFLETSKLKPSSTVLVLGLGL